MTTRHWGVAALALALASGACKDKDGANGEASAKPKPGDGLARTKGPPGTLPTSRAPVAVEREATVFVRVDAKGAVSVGVVPHDRDGGEWAARPARVPAETTYLYQTLHAGQMAGQDDEGLREILKGAGSEEVDPELLAALADDLEELPPPEPPEEPEEIDDELGGVGTAMALDEGKMGSAPRRPRVELLPRAATDEEYAGAGVPDAPAASRAPTDRWSTGGRLRTEPSTEVTTLVVADATTPALDLVPILRLVRGAGLAVRGPDGKLGRSAVALNLEVRKTMGSEIRRERLVDLEANGATVRSGPGATHGTVPWRGDELDAAAIDAAWRAMVAEEPDRHDVQVSLGAGVSVARLVAAIDALVAAGAQQVELRDWTRPALRGAHMIFGGIQVTGDLDRIVIRRKLSAQAVALRTCFADAAAKQPDLGGTVEVRFFVTPAGKVTKAEAEGVSDAVAACVKQVIGALAVPEATSGLSVTHAITFTNLP